MKRLATLACCVAFSFVSTLTAQAQQHDPSPSLKPPASMEEFSMTSHGSRINGIVYLAAGARPRPVVIFLHGYPGNEKNLDLAQTVRRAGYQVVYTDYRGIWGSGGTFGFANGLEDVQALLAWVRTPANALKYHFDTRRIALVGHSFGGWLAIMTAAQEPRSVCVAALAAWNVGWAGQRFATHPGERTAGLEDFRSSTSEGAPVHASALDLVNEMASNPDWDYVKQARGIGDRATLLVAATRDSPDEDIAMHRAMARAIREAGGKHVKVVTYDDDHPFSSHRLALAGQLTRWLSNDCATMQPRR